MARVVRGQVISLKHEPFIEAARALGVSRLAIIIRHILPNLISIVIVYLTLTIPSVMLFVQSLRGLSHTREEDTRVEDIELSVRALDRLTDLTIEKVETL